MKRDDLFTAKNIERELSDLESKLAHYKGVTKLVISSAVTFELADYPEPSRIGAAFRGVQGSIVTMLEEQVADAKGRLAKLGVEC